VDQGGGMKKTIVGLLCPDAFDLVFGVAYPQSSVEAEHVLVLDIFRLF
jgi:hypothetical protein